MTDNIENLSQLLIMSGLAVLAIEVIILGFSTFILSFLGLALVLTGGLVATDSIPANLLSATSSVAVLTALLAAVLWKPLKKLQNTPETKPVTSDLVGYRFVLSGPVAPNMPGETQYSGVRWQVISDISLNAGDHVETIEVNVGVLKVKRVEE